MIGRLSSWLICLFFLSCSSSQEISQNTIESSDSVHPLVLEGAYQGKNLYVQNPYADGLYCMTKVVVNGAIVLGSVDLQSSAIEIKLDSLIKNIGDAVKIEISHKANCRPKVLNTGM